MHEVYLWPFQNAVKAGVGAFMCSYNRINGSYGCQNSKNLNGLLKEELGFQGYVSAGPLLLFIRFMLTRARLCLIGEPLILDGLPQKLVRTWTCLEPLASPKEDLPISVPTLQEASTTGAYPWIDWMICADGS